MESECKDTYELEHSHPILLQFFSFLFMAVSVYTWFDNRFLFWWLTPVRHIFFSFGTHILSVYIIFSYMNVIITAVQWVQTGLGKNTIDIAWECRRGTNKLSCMEGCPLTTSSIELWAYGTCMLYRGSGKQGLIHQFMHGKIE